MSVFRHISTTRRRLAYMPLLVAVFVAGNVATSPAQAATLGHSRLVSAVGEPLRITIPVTQISGSQINSLRVEPAPASEWTRAGLTPPVDLATIQARLGDGFVPGAYVLQVWSDAVFNQPIADLLLDIHTSSGVQRYQVSLLARGGATAIQAPSAQGSAAIGGAKPASGSFDQKPVLVRRGDTMFAIAGRHAVPGVSVYQMMIALQRANPHAFIHDNINLVKAGEQLSMPDMAALTAISDREARRLFHEQVVAFNVYRQKLGGSVSGDAAALHVAPLNAPDHASPDNIASNIPQSRTAEGDQLRLSSGRAAVAAGSQSSADGASDRVQTDDEGAADAKGSVSQLAQNMATGVSKTASAATADGTTAAPLPGFSAQDTPAAATSATDTAAGTASTENAASPASTVGATESTPTTDGTDSTSAVSVAGSASAADVATQASAQGAAGSAPATGSTSSAASTGHGALTPSDSSAALDEDARADDALAARKAISDAEQRVSQLEKNVKNLNQALQSQGEAAKDVVVDGALGLRQSLTDVATAVTDATIGDEEYLNGPSLSGSAKSGQTDATSTQDDASNASTTPQDNTTTSTMESLTHWLSANLIGVITGILALIALVIAWVLRRANVNQARADSAVTPEMVKEKLEQINLDLNEPTVNDSSSPR